MRVKQICSQCAGRGFNMVPLFTEVSGVWMMQRITCPACNGQGKR